MNKKTKKELNQLKLEDFGTLLSNQETSAVRGGKTTSSQDDGDADGVAG